MSKNLKRTSAILLILLIVFSVITFVLPFKKNTLFWISYAFGVFAILFQLYVLMKAFHGTESVRSRFYGFPIAKVGLIYMVIQIILSIVFMALAFFVPAWIGALLFVLLLAFALIGFIGADAMRDEIERQDKKLEADTSCMTTLRSLVYPLAERCDDPEAKAKLEKLADEFRYSDPVSNGTLRPVEAELETAVSELQAEVSGGDQNRIIRAVNKTSGLLAERNRLCKLNKKK